MYKNVLPIKYNVINEQKVAVCNYILEGWKRYFDNQLSCKRSNFKAILLINLSWFSQSSNKRMSNTPSNLQFTFVCFEQYFEDLTRIEYFHFTHWLCNLEKFDIVCSEMLHYHLCVFHHNVKNSVTDATEYYFF